jgi:hypothetical protein
MAQPSEILDTVSVISLLVLCLLGIRRLLRIEGLHALRVVVFTALLWVGVLLLFSLVFSFPSSPGCVSLSDEESGFSISACC